jgi:hypothetical protein
VRQTHLEGGEGCVKHSLKGEKGASNTLGDTCGALGDTCGAALRFGWNYESFHTLLSESLAHELRVAAQTVERRDKWANVGGGGGGDKGGEEASGEKDETGAREGGTSREAGVRAGGDAGGGWCVGKRAWLVEVGLRLRGLTSLREILKELLATDAGREAGLQAPPGLRRLEQLCAELRACSSGS